MFRSTNTVFRPRSLAIVGASDRGEGNWAKSIFDNLKDAGFPAPVHLINPKRDSLWGQRCYPNFAAIGERVDHALVVIPADAVVPALTEGAQNGLSSATVYAAGFGEGEDQYGRARAGELTALTRQYDIRICGPNCMGTVSVPERLTLYPSRIVHRLAAGPVGAVCQSGGTLQFLIEQATERGLGFSYAVTSGNELDLDLADFLNFLVEDSRTRLILCLIESIRRPEAFVAAARKALAARKPILVVKIGRTELAREQAKSHTGAVAGDDRVFDAVCNRYGIARCSTLEDLVETGLAFSAGRIPAGRRMGLVTTSGAVKGLILDAAGAQGCTWGALSDTTTHRLGEMVSAVNRIDNPLDCGPAAASDASLYAELCKTIVHDDGIDLLAMLTRAPLREGQPPPAEPFAMLAAGTAKPVLAFAHMARPSTDVSRKFQRAAAMPFLHGIAQVVRAMCALADYGECVRRGIPEIPPPAGRAEDAHSSGLKRLLATRNVEAPREILAQSPEAAAAAAREIGFPVALKLISHDASHKTEVGGVRLNLTGEAAVADAAREMQDKLGHGPQAIVIEGFQVQEMIDGVEIIVGLREDPQFGSFVMIGLGGIFVEVLDDVSLRLLPVTADDVREMLAQLRGYPVLNGARGRPACDIDALVAAVLGLGEVFLDLRPWLSDIEVNPLIVLGRGNGVRAVDVRTIPRAGTP